MLHTLLKWVRKALDTAGFMRVGCPEIGLVSSVRGCPPIQTPAKLWLAAQCLRWVSVKGPHEDYNVDLTCGLKVAAAESGVWVTIVPHALHRIVDTIVMKGQLTIVAPFVELGRSFPPPSFCREVKQTTGYLLP
jgi:hypothetical protein